MSTATLSPCRTNGTTRHQDRWTLAPPGMVPMPQVEFSSSPAEFLHDRAFLSSTGRVVVPCVVIAPVDGDALDGMLEAHDGDETAVGLLLASAITRTVQKGVQHETPYSTNTEDAATGP